jgi:phosphate transport system protein
MRVLLQREIERLKRQVLALSAEVEGDVQAAVRAVERRDEALAERVIAREARTNAMEVDVEEEALKVLALHQPVAADLRYLVAVMRINQDLERIGDLATHIAERARALCRLPPADKSFQLGPMGEVARQALKKAMDAFVTVDEQAAREVLAADCLLDDMNRAVFEDVKAAVVRDGLLFETLIQILHVARHLERIGDHATNIAEDLIYLIEGKIVRHGNGASGHAPAPRLERPDLDATGTGGN